MERKNAAGLYIAVLTGILAAAGLIAYIMNTQTNYYAKMGISTEVLLAVGGAIVLVLLEILIGLKGTPLIVDIIAILVPVALMLGVAFLLNVRINNLAAVFTFENSAANMADTRSCIVAIACVVLAWLFSVLNAFADISKVKA